MKKNIINDASTSPTTNEGDGGIERWKENLQNTFIEWSVKPIGQLCCRWDVSDTPLYLQS